MPPRPYVSPHRDAAAAIRRAEVVAAASRVLRGSEGLAAFSLDAVAKAAGVTRLTVYNQFGSRRGLLEAVLDDLARQGGLGRIPEAMAMPARAGLDRLVEIFCDFWGGDPAMPSLQAAKAVDPDFAQALAERNERRRLLIGALVERLPPDERPDASRHRDAVDLIFALTGHAMFETLHAGRTTEEVCTLLKSACAAALAG
ncbi:TetR/AcrR family transcriptional regulator [Labrys wisconsinensis]|uniref:AcrR family transcriptional regulator n=1 Tax=Labrys wisconsinensis TaxID=425677 RepID=A0ABU0JI08_9HYPH|nr:TetR/AcrR family transcriptional regulator [Labrys wisconsinensis]MDQ0473131.1 AcrR family transcriptional regulator [Labrys wisconsinensis]